MIRTTQVNSLKQLKPKIGSRRQTIYDAIKHLTSTVHIPVTNRMIAKHLGWDINRVTGRVTELVDLGKVKSNGTHKDLQTNRTVTVWETI